MSSYHISSKYWPDLLQGQIAEFEKRGLVTRTFRRLDPDRQHQVIDAFLQEGAKAGPGAVNIKKAAARAGVSVGALYTYFPNRRALQQFVVEICVGVTVAMFSAYKDTLADLPLMQALTEYLSGGMAWSEAQLAMARFFARAAFQDDSDDARAIVAPVADAMLSMVRAILEGAKSRGELRADLDMEATARVVHAAFIGVADPQILPHLNTYYQVVSDECPAKRTTAGLIDILMHGIKANRQ